jgi:hypothetical protein
MNTLLTHNNNQSGKYTFNNRRLSEEHTSSDKLAGPHSSIDMLSSNGTEPKFKAHIEHRVAESQAKSGLKATEEIFGNDSEEEEISNIELILGGLAYKLAHTHFKIKSDNSDIKSEKINTKIGSIQSVSTDAFSPNTSPQDKKIRKMKVQTYRLSRYQKLLSIFHAIGEIEENVLILAYIYLENILETFELQDGKYLKGMYATCVLLAHKFIIEDEYWPLEEFCKMVGVNENQIRKWEVQILDCLEYQLYVPAEQFDSEKSDITCF